MNGNTHLIHVDNTTRKTVDYLTLASFTRISVQSNLIEQLLNSNTKSIVWNTRWKCMAQFTHRCSFRPEVLSRRLGQVKSCWFFAHKLLFFKCKIFKYAGSLELVYILRPAKSCQILSADVSQIYIFLKKI